jgi:hypothetical protein
VLVGCKKDLRFDPLVMEDLRKKEKLPVSTQEVRTRFSSSYWLP